VSNQTYIANEPRIALESINGETIIIDFESGVFNAPVLEAFKDMQEILLLDPIHDTSQKGWPLKK